MVQLSGVSGETLRHFALGIYCTNARGYCKVIVLPGGNVPDDQGSWYEYAVLPVSVNHSGLSNANASPITC